MAGKYLLDNLADSLDGEDIAEDDVPHDGVAEQESLLLLFIKQHQAM